VVGALSETGEIAAYPGSPAIARAWLRPQYRLIACEIEPRAADALARNMRGDPRIKTQTVDGWTAFAACVPPHERRRLVLVDPPF
jgi:23S rRNA (adenine2030-N6)-methyltransferase